MTSHLRPGPSMRTSWKRIRNWIPNTIIWLYGGTDRPFRCRLFKQEDPLLFLIGSISTRFKRVFRQRRRAWLRDRYTWWASINDFDDATTAVDLRWLQQDKMASEDRKMDDEMNKNDTTLNTRVGLGPELNRGRIFKSGGFFNYIFSPRTGRGLSVFCPVPRSGFERGKKMKTRS